MVLNLAVATLHRRRRWWWRWWWWRRCHFLLLGTRETRHRSRNSVGGEVRRLRRSPRLLVVVERSLVEPPRRIVRLARERHERVGGRDELRESVSVGLHRLDGAFAGLGDPARRGARLFRDGARSHGARATARARLLGRREISLEPLTTVALPAASSRRVHGPREGESVLLHAGIDLGSKILLQDAIADPIPARHGLVNSGEERRALTRVFVRGFAVVLQLVRPPCKLS